MPRPPKKKIVVEHDAQWRIFGELKTKYQLNQEIRIEYSGSGDSGNSDYFASTPDTLPVGARDEIEDAFWNILCNIHGGWENEDGGQGTATIDFKAGTLEWNHGDNYTETTSRNHEGTFGG